MYVTSDMACNQPNSATPMSQARITAQNNRVAKVGSQFENGNAILSNLVQKLGGIGIGNPPGTSPRTTTPTFVNSPACSTAVLTGGGIYGRRLPVLGGPTGQPMLQPDGTWALPATPGAPSLATVGASTNGASLVSTAPAVPAVANAATIGLENNVPGGSSPGITPTTLGGGGLYDGTGYCAANRPSIPAQPGGTDVNPMWLLGGLLFIVGISAMMGKN